MAKSFGISLLAILVSGAPAWGHGVEIHYQAQPSYTLTVRYDSGQPMAGGQVTVYAPDNPREPWLRGTTDDQGQFSFSPDPTQPGYWEVKVRQAGHGTLIAIPVPEGDRPAIAMANSPNQEGAASSAYTPLQKGIMAGAVAWGFVGTALFFKRSKQ